MIINEFFNFLVHKNDLDEDLIKEELSESDVDGLKLKQFLLSRRYLSEVEYLKSLANYLKFSYIEEIPSIDSEELKDFVEKIPYPLIYKYLFFPYKQNKEEITFAIADPKSIPICEEIAEIYNKKATITLTKESNIINIIQKEYKITDGDAIEQDDKADSEASYEVEDLLSSDDEEPIRRLVNSIIFQALKTNSSDIHIDATSELTYVRNRIDGVLQQMNSFPKHGHNRIINRIKVMSGLDISTRNVPQDGRALIKIAGKKVDIRVSVIPTIHGERVVLRLLQQSYQLLNIQELGFTSEIGKEILDATSSPNGIILVTGPTGSGKTTTLYACLQSIDHNARNVITIEDPVEYQISGYGQVQVNEKQGLTFAAGLRTILRQDPDVIMVGEIRDTETAQIAIQSALTGHLVLSTLHTNDAVSTVIRLFDMDIEPFLISSTLKCVLSQRLIRSLCTNCKKKRVLKWEDLKAFSVPKALKKEYQGYVYEAVGCAKCTKTGYKGRLGVHELLKIDDKIKEAIHKQANSLELEKTAFESGCLHPLSHDCFRKCFEGITSLNEIHRLLFTIKHNDENEQSV